MYTEVEMNRCSMSAKTDADRSTQDFATWIELILDRMKLTRADLAEMTGLDASTLSRIASGETSPLYSTALAIVSAIAKRDQAMAGLLAHNLFELIAPPIDNGDHDYNHDGRSDGEDMVRAAAWIGQAASEMMLATLEALSDRQVTDCDWVKITQLHGRLQRHAAAHERICHAERDRWARTIQAPRPR
jgi:transcriptional regulator with XRE-family HTH domain